MKRPLMKKESRQLMLSVGVLAVLSICVYILMIWEPQQAELARVSLRRAEIKTVQLEMDGFNRLHPDAVGYGRELGRRYQRVSGLFLLNEGEQEAFFRSTLPGLAEQAGLTVEALGMVSQAEGKQYDRQTGELPEKVQPRLCRLTVRGDYRAVTNFVERLEQGEKFAALKSWQVKSAGDKGRPGELRLEMIVEAYERKK